ncbi:ETX/MTX2 family pore-forming toxin [Enterococcus faecalis]|uniref:ETX/MTX2 family pore-forming toxin n=1 Tax=Enterococcus faecalis TaxID=1351 RepID=UPI001785B76F|nr:ETX/MTX2 family pore-forming toxin [Enterococcus faecalis]MBD9891255.1 ETX/MTX2 family pore-forming toxin [Enterococcus faecalis]MBD9927672.1 ETX/MTX2 family pore-forming toxin [Enterococcus faecalis]HCQ8731931.1 ETX/MTX2 family pore-forming toxin [Enterococcus faecalis]
MSKKTTLSFITISMLSPILFQLNAYANTVNIPQSDSLQAVEGSSEKNNIDINDGTATMNQELSHLAVSLSMNKYRNGDIGFDNLIWPGTIATFPWNFDQIPFANVNNDMKLKDGKTLAANSSTLNNDTGTDQTLSTPSFEYTSTDSVTTSTTHSAGVSLTTSAEMSFPIAKGSLSMTVKYDFSNTNEVSSSETRKWTVPSQQIVVPAGRHYKVNWVLTTGVATGTTDLTSKVKAMVPFKRVSGSRDGLSVGDAINTQNDLKNKLPNSTIWQDEGRWSVVSSDAALRKWSVATYIAEYGTDLIMNIEDVTDTKSFPILVQSIPMNLTPITVLDKD